MPTPDTSPTGGPLAALYSAAGIGVPGDVEGSAQGDLDRRGRAADAAAKFPANEADAAQQFQGVGAQGSTQMIQQLVSGITGALGGAVGGIMGPLTQLPQQAMQVGQGAMQPLMSALQGAHGAAEAAEGSSLVDSVEGETGGGAGGGGAFGSGSGGVGGGGTTPTGYLGPPPVPSSSPPTTPAGAPAKPVMMTPTGGTLPMSGQSGMTGMPMMPPGAMGAHGEAGGKHDAPEKRIAAPGVPNGQPVKGRLTIPPGAPLAAKPGEAKPTVVTNRPARRIVILPNDDEPKE
ncbi:hypothetical protein AWB93_06190 [Mycobacterium bohemicum]|uniref:Uncharacterized protein n=3 Tax=Mycobacterium bohemicum TaxID=56425 RepID=A0A1X1RB91_MYCBE|nr:hypothetical protein [Mycobacterium bohemicum]ORV02398.1 hypothetical protein AWB93_06190 [Mycobacterium bohemicum]